MMRPVAALFLAAAALLSLAGTPSRTKRIVMLECVVEYFSYFIACKNAWTETHGSKI